jgi:hypothetical protein
VPREYEITSLRSQYLKGDRSPECLEANAEWMRAYRLRKKGGIMRDPEQCTFCRKMWDRNAITKHERVCTARGT